MTLNTGFDEIYAVERLAYGGVASVLSHQTLASGKGVNAARTIRAFGEEVVAYGLVGLEDRGHFEALLKLDGVQAKFVPIATPTRHNLTLLVSEAAAPAAHFRASGFTLSDRRPIASLVEVLERDIRPGDVVTLNGSLPLGVDAGTWGQIGTTALNRGADVLLDVQGAAFREALETVQCTICKPNDEEAAILLGEAASDSGRERVVAAVEYMLARGVSLPVISLGAEGLVFAFEGRLWEGTCSVSRVSVAVGAGDALVAGMAMGVKRQLPAPEIIRLGLSVAAAHVEGVSMDVLAARADELQSSVVLRQRPW